MEQFKIDYFNRDYLGVVLSVTKVAPLEIEALQATICSRFGFCPSVRGLDLLRLIHAATVALTDFDAERADFSLEKVFLQLGISPTARVYLNWRQFDDVDLVDCRQLIKYFDYFWYPSSDDVEVLAETGEWIISISHHGRLAVATPPSE